ncbi:DNA replication factor Cdt1 [Genypterus blacodes]|uniref:DNA replication factor Cdt1 n=1 Tax=Genypterus blacodes TaxID=154954 RepID=UPI003F757A92
MSQARVTDFFHQRKKGIAGQKSTKPRSSRSTVVSDHGSCVTSAATRSKSLRSDNKEATKIDACIFSPSVHEEFLRVIDEAAGVNTDEACHMPGGGVSTSPRTPKRSSSDAEFDLGSALFSATVEHSTAKKRRHAGTSGASKATAPQKQTRRTARKKLVLVQDEQPVSVQEPVSDVQPEATTETAKEAKKNTGSPQKKSSQTTGGETSRVLCTKDIAALKSRLQKIKKQAGDLSSSTPASLSSAPTAPPTAEPNRPKSTVARARELAAKAQKRKEEREAEESQQSQIQSQESTELPAYQRYHTLAQAAPPGLSLPFPYKLLAEMFRSMDTVVGMLHNRSETATFAKIKQGVQDLMHKRFEESHVAQIKAVFPDAYTFRQEKNIPNFSCQVKRSSYQLTVEPVIHSDQNESRPLLLASCLLERRRIFHSNLLAIVKQHHKDFLSSLVPAVTVPEDKLTRWHPRFNVDTVPAVSASDLPQPPHTEKMATAQEVLDKARSLITPKMEKALVSLTLKTEEPGKEVASQTSTASPTPTPAPSALKGVPQSLLDRIRAKEAQKLQSAMTRNTAQEGRLLMMSRLNELARILRNVFVAEKKPALIMEVVCNKMVSSYRSALSTGEMEKHIRLLAELAADWLTVLPIRKDFYVKLNKTMELNVVLDKLSSKLREEERR